MPSPEPRKADSWAVSLARIAGAVALFAYHYLNDMSLQGGSTYANDGPLGFLGFVGVAIFIVVSGAVLARPFEREQKYGVFVRQRMWRLLRLFWWVAVPLTLAAVVAGYVSPTQLSRAPLWLLGLNFLHPEAFRPLVDAWWYIGLALQIVIVYPLLRSMVRLFGPDRALVVSASVVALSALLVSQMPDQWVYLLDGFVGVRLLELTFGVVIGHAYMGISEQSSAWRTTPLLICLALLVVVVRSELALRLAAGVVAGVFVLSLVSLEERIAARQAALPVRALNFLGGITFGFFLVHPLVVRVTVSIAVLACQLCRVAAVPLALVAGVVAAWAVHASHRRFVRWLAT